jgi:transcriptional regulator with XRE-family HTH domain
MHSEIVKKIRKLRIEKGISKEEMATHLCIDLSAYTRLESGKATTWGKYFEKIITIFEITPSNFFEGIEIKDVSLQKLNETAVEGTNE